jgi:hypothetical protein
MMQRWLASVLLHCEKGFRRIKGFASIPDVIAHIKAEEENSVSVKKAASGELVIATQIVSTKNLTSSNFLPICSKVAQRR